MVSKMNDVLVTQESFSIYLAVTHNLDSRNVFKTRLFAYTSLQFSAVLFFLIFNKDL